MEQIILKAVADSIADQIGETDGVEFSTVSLGEMNHTDEYFQQVVKFYWTASRSNGLGDVDYQDRSVEIGMYVNLHRGTFGYGSGWTERVINALSLREAASFIRANGR